MVERTTTRGGPRQRATQLSQLDEEQVAAGAGTGRRDQGLDRVRREAVDQDAVGVDRGGFLGVELEVGDLGRGHLGERVDLGPQGTQRGEGAGTRLGVALHHRVEHDELPAAHVGGQPLHVGHLEDPGHARHRLGCVRGPLAPRGEDAPRVPPVPGQHPGVRRPDRQQVELESRDDPEAAAAAAGRPQQVRVLGLGGAHERPVRQHQLDGRDRAALQAVLAGVPAHAAAERRPDHAHTRAGHVHRGQPDPAGPGDDVAPEHAGLGARRTAGGVDAQPGHRRGAQQDGVAESAGERRCAVAGALGGDPEAGRRGGPHDPGDLLRVGRVGDRCRVLVHLEVPGHPRLVVEGIPRQVDGTAGQPAQRLGVGGREARGLGHRHHLTIWAPQHGRGDLRMT